jgi:hypothetical protein
MSLNKIKNNVLGLQIKVNCVFLQRGLGWGSRMDHKMKERPGRQKKKSQGSALGFTGYWEQKRKNDN